MNVIDLLKSKKHNHFTKGGFDYFDYTYTKIAVKENIVFIRVAKKTVKIEGDVFINNYKFIMNFLYAENIFLNTDKTTIDNYKFIDKVKMILSEGVVLSDGSLGFGDFKIGSVKNVLRVPDSYIFRCVKAARKEDAKRYNPKKNEYLIDERVDQINTEKQKNILFEIGATLIDYIKIKGE